MPNHLGGGGGVDAPPPPGDAELFSKTLGRMDWLGSPSSQGMGRNEASILLAPKAPKKILPVSLKHRKGRKGGRESRGGYRPSSSGVRPI